MTVQGLLKDGRIIASANITTQRPTAAGYVTLTATVSDLRKAEKILKWDLTMTPIQRLENVINEQITDNIVGGTVYAAAGGTLSGSCTVLGF